MAGTHDISQLQAAGKAPQVATGLQYFGNEVISDAFRSLPAKKLSRLLSILPFWQLGA